MMETQPWEDDDHLLTELRAALGPPDVPAAVLTAAKAVYTWRTIDIELAELAFDSAVTDDVPTGVRGEAATLRTLSFETGNLAIEVGITSDTLIGQFTPAQPGMVEVHALDGVRARFEVDDRGCFSVDPVPSGRFRLAFTMTHTGRVITDWVTL
jgi:hypothetical protein